MNTDNIMRRPGGLFTIGTTGWWIAAHYEALRREQLLGSREGGERTASARTILAIDSAQASREIAVRAGPGHPVTRVAPEDALILPVRTVHDLADECMRGQRTRRYGEKLRRLPDAATEDGVGATPLVALANGLACKQQIDRMIEARILAQRDRARIDGHHDRGEGFALEARSIQIIGGNMGGGTFPGLALFVAQRITHYSRLYLGQPSEIAIFGTTPSALSGGDVTKAQANFTTFVRQAVIAMQQPQRIVFHALTGEELRAETPIVHRIVPWGRSSGRLSIGTREEITGQVALAAAVLLDTPYTAFADAQFRDHKDEAHDERYGTRVFARMGVSRWAIDGKRDDAIAHAEGVRLVSEHMLGGASGTRTNSN